MSNLKSRLVESVCNHLILPPKLPGKADKEPRLIENNLTERVLDAISILERLTGPIYSRKSGVLKKCIEACITIREDGQLNRASLLAILRDLDNGDYLIIYVKEQNAALLLRRQVTTNGDVVQFESFECSARSKDVMATENALLWDFPGSSASLPSEKFFNSGFQKNLARFLEESSNVAFDRFSPHTRKAGTSVVETRDTADPSLISGMLMSLLEANGTRSYPTLLRKRVRDDVCWNNSEISWRRSSFWLILRVSVQRIVYALLGCEVGRVYYKFLICAILARLLDDSLQVLSPELSHYIKAKLSRRLAKLENEKMALQTCHYNAYDFFFATIGACFKQSLSDANNHISFDWLKFKNSIRKRIPRLPYSAGLSDVQLQLKNSAPVIENALKAFATDKSKAKNLTTSTHTGQFDISSLELGPIKSYADDYFAIADTEIWINSEEANVQFKHGGQEKKCKELIESLLKYMEKSLTLCKGNPECMSICILNIFTLWVRVDEYAIRTYPLLSDYHPGLCPESLEVLQLSRLEDLSRLRKIQAYLRKRCTSCKPLGLTIFANPQMGFFAERYYNEGYNTVVLKKVEDSIDQGSEDAKRSKIAEFDSKKARYDHLSQIRSQSACTQERRADGSHIAVDCKYCSAGKERKKIGINVHEDYLPSTTTSSDLLQRKALIFELAIDEIFKLYRDTTWRIYVTLATSKSFSNSASPKVLLRNYGPLRRYSYFGFSNSAVLCLGSTTKSFSVTHYDYQKFPTTLDKVVLPHGLHHSFYDSTVRVWAEELLREQAFILEHQCRIRRIDASPLLDYITTSSFRPGEGGPPSNEIIASQSECPLAHSVNEFTALQSLFSGHVRRWPVLLTEFGSSNLNFSSEVTMLVFNQLVLEAGPSQSESPLGVVHAVFADSNFTRRLIDLVKEHALSIASNWREIFHMDLLITMTYRLHALSCDDISQTAAEAIKILRKYTLSWSNLLRVEITRKKDSDDIQNLSRYALWASLLCRRTYCIEIGNLGHLDSEALSIFFEASMIMQNNLTGCPKSFPRTLQNSLTRDLKIVHCINHLICKSIDRHPECLNEAINTYWPQPSSCQRTYCHWQYVSSDGWVRSTVLASHIHRQQIVYYHIPLGYLVIDGSLIGRSTDVDKNPGLFKELFDEYHPQMYPSGMSGMSYVLAKSYGGHQVHFGARDGKIVVRACVGNAVLEYIDRDTFRSSTSYDLPESLIEECIHWLDLETGVIEIRLKPGIWGFDRPGNWKVNFKSRKSERGSCELVDTQGSLFKRFVRIFKHFENGDKLTVFQPNGKGLTVELKRLQLTFTVDKRGLLYSRELDSVIDPNQDAGTFYGMLSHLVLLDRHNSQKRSVIVPVGTIRYERYKMHVLSAVENKGSFARYFIDEVLGRLQCPAEPHLLYHKAYIHAITSFVISDPLTGRTGTEEALSCLQSGFSQPWTLLGSLDMDILNNIRKLTPLREYYPRHLKCQQEVSWDSQLTVSIQHESFRSVVEDIFRKVERLSTFTEKNIAIPKSAANHEHRLWYRSKWRRQQLERTSSYLARHKKPVDDVYQSRSSHRTSVSRSNVLEVASLLCDQPRSFATTRDLAGSLSVSRHIGGYQKVFDEPLSDLFDTSIITSWGSLVKFCLKSKRNVFDLMFLSGVIAFSDSANMDLVRTLLAFHIFNEFDDLQVPPHISYLDFEPFEKPSVDRITSLVEECCKPFRTDNETTNRQRSQMTSEQLERAEEDHDDKCMAAAQKYASFIIEQWPLDLTRLGEPSNHLVRKKDAIKRISPEWCRLRQNLDLSHHLQHVQKILDLRYSETRQASPIQAVKAQEIFQRSGDGCNLPTLMQDVMIKPISFLRETKSYTEHESAMAEGTNNVKHETMAQNYIPGKEHVELEMIVNGFSICGCPVREQYGQDLQSSLKALAGKRMNIRSSEDVTSNVALCSKMFLYKSQMHELFNQICEALMGNDARLHWLEMGNLSPCITKVTILEQLRLNTRDSIPESTKEAIISFGVLVTIVQQYLRMKEALSKKKFNVLAEEQGNIAHENWKPLNHPDWLLFEIDSDILVRKDQVDVARATIWPMSGSNSVLQMNMGQGKTSCIMPIVAAFLADTSQLCRIIVPKALLQQTAQILQSRLGGLLGREISHVPYSRKSSTTLTATEAYVKFHEDVMKSAGVLLSLQEHILSFKLSGIQCLSDAQYTEASNLIKAEDQISSKCRDILDECDFTLSTRTQLIYPSGTQSIVDGQAHRWRCIQALLELIGAHAVDLEKQYPNSIKITKRPGTGYPIIHFLRRDIEDMLQDRLATDLCEGHTLILGTDGVSREHRESFKNFVLGKKVHESLTKDIHMFLTKKVVFNEIIFLLRGLLGHKLLLLCLKKRWNVHYGIHPRRDPIAVPFEAKGIPSEQNEWGQPDVSIILTCLSYSYSGLTLGQFRESLKHVLGSNDPAAEYDKWTQTSISLPIALRYWNVINIEDEGQVMELFGYLRYDLTVINHFLNTFVFPKHAKQFSMKIQASGWDVPLLDKSTFTGKRTSDFGNQNKAMTTGFSGTNDIKRLLPLTISQDDLPGLSHTNAEVLSYLLQPRNRNVQAVTQTDGQPLSETALLRKLAAMHICVLIDAGAYIQEMSNYDLAKAWLDVYPDAQAAVFFSKDNRASIVYRNGKLVPLVASPFAANMEKCVVYLDQAHTRGTDLKLPPLAHGALTLGLTQTKDHTVQAAMRLRQLGSTQCITFFAPPEVHQSILDFRKKGLESNLESPDVVSWLLEQICINNEQQFHLYYAQGMNFCYRKDAVRTYPNFIEDYRHRQNYLDVIRQSEQRSLEELYKPKCNDVNFEKESFSSSDLQRFSDILHDRRLQIRDDHRIIGSVLEEVEQEREVAHEVEEVRQKQKPKRYRAYPSEDIQAAVVNFALNGRPTHNFRFETVFEIMDKTAVGFRHGLKMKSYKSNLFVSPPFSRTVEIAVNRPNDNFLRPVNWLLWSASAQMALLVIPEEAEALIKILREAKNPPTRLLVYAAPVTKVMMHFNRLTFYSIPSLPEDFVPPMWLTVELGLFSGRLYFHYDEYAAVLNLLGLENHDSSITGNASGGNDESGERNSADGQLHQYQHTRQKGNFTDNPLSFLQDWLALRRKDQDFSYSPMGYICQGRRLKSDHAFFISISAAVTHNPTASDRKICQLYAGAEVDEDDNGDDIFDEMQEESDGDLGNEEEIEYESESGVGEFDYMLDKFDFKQAN